MRFLLSASLTLFTPLARTAPGINLQGPARSGLPARQADARRACPRLPVERGDRRSLHQPQPPAVNSNPSSFCSAAEGCGVRTCSFGSVERRAGRSLRRVQCHAAGPLKTSARVRLTLGRDRPGPERPAMAAALHGTGRGHPLGRGYTFQTGGTRSGAITAAIVPVPSEHTAGGPREPRIVPPRSIGESLPMTSFQLLTAGPFR